MLFPCRLKPDFHRFLLGMRPSAVECRTAAWSIGYRASVCIGGNSFSRNSEQGLNHSIKTTHQRTSGLRHDGTRFEQRTAHCTFSINDRVTLSEQGKGRFGACLWTGMVVDFGRERITVRIVVDGNAITTISSIGSAWNHQRVACHFDALAANRVTALFSVGRQGP
jgi:hypothetical protein